LLVVFHIAAPDTGAARPACAAGAVSQLGALREKPTSPPAARAFCAQASPFRFASALCDLCCNRAWERRSFHRLRTSARMMRSNYSSERTVAGWAAVVSYGLCAATAAQLKR